MSSMYSSPNFLITSYLTSYSSHEELRTKLFEKGVMCKEYNDDGLLLFYHKYDVPCSSELERECRSLIVDKETRMIKSYSCETPLLNKKGMEYLLSHSDSKQIITPCYEGTLLSLFHHNDKWYLSTRRCLNSQESIFNQETKVSHYDMFEDILKKSGYESYEVFCSGLEKTHSYYFIIIHHMNRHLIDYTSQFGKSYSKLCLVSIRDVHMNEVSLYEGEFSFVKEHIFIPKKMETIDEFVVENNNTKYDDIPSNEGIVIRIWNDETIKYNLIKLQNNSYQFHQVIGTDSNIFKGLIYLYQNDKLKDFFKQNVKMQNIQKITNPFNTTEAYDTIGVVDSVFKVCTSELFELFKNLWSIKTGKHQNIELYNLLPKEYKDIMFAIRGIYYKKKAMQFQTKSAGIAEASVPNPNNYLRITDIYNHIKTLPADFLIAFLRMRKLMFNWSRYESSNVSLRDFSMTSNVCDKVHLKLCAIFTNKLFPDIMPNDFPPQKAEIVSK